MYSRSSSYLSIVWIAAALALAPFQVHAATEAEAHFPSRPITLVVPYAPGGGLDVAARVLAPKLSEYMGQPWVIENRTGAAGNIAAEYVARAPADGYTILFALNTQLTANPALYDLKFSVEKDLQPVSLVATQDHIVVVSKDLPATTLPQLVALARQKPGTLNYGSGGVGSSVQLGAELLKKRAGINLVHVPYRGTAPAIAGMLSGQVQVMVAGASAIIPYIRDGRVRALATTGLTRSTLLPDVPTVAELGYPGFEVLAWFGLMVPAGTPPAIVERIRAAMAKVLQEHDVQEALRRQGLEPEMSTPSALASRIRLEAKTWTDVIKDAGIRVQ
jgi:tripartite-type tricarboxylate transporter receptor subunit TctC